MNEHWSYDKTKRFDQNGQRWHFVMRDFHSLAEGEDEPREYYFRDDARLQFGVVRFDRIKDFPYRDYESFVKKIMNQEDFRSKHLDSETKDIWNKNWK